MKNFYQLLYILSSVLILMVLTGGSLTKPFFNSLSVRSLEKIGVNKSSIDSIDNHIDEMLFKVNKLTFQFEKIKNIFSGEEPDYSRLYKSKNEIIYLNVYSPVNEVLIIIYRLVFLLIAVIVLFSAVTVYLIYKSTDLKRRLVNLEIQFKKLSINN